MAKKFRKNPDVHIALIPGHGRLSPSMVLEGDQYEKYTLAAYGKILVAAEDEGTAVPDDVPTNIVVQPPAGTAALQPTSEPEHVVGLPLVDMSDVPPSSTVAPVMDAAVVDVSDVPPTEALKMVEEARSEEGDNSASDVMSSAVIDGLSLRKLKKLAAAHDISLPRSAKTVAQIREHIRGVLFPSSAG